VAQLSACDPLPLVILIPGERDPAAGFATALAHPAHASRIIPLARMAARVPRETKR
jgi:hypothetical protein